MIMIIAMIIIQCCLLLQGGLLIPILGNTATKKDMIINLRSEASVRPPSAGPLVPEAAGADHLLPVGLLLRARPAVQLRAVL